MWKKLIEAMLCLMIVTAYQYNATTAQCGNSKGITYSGTHVRPGIIAVSHDLKHLMGRKVLIKGFGTYRVEDLMHKKHRKCIDIYSNSITEARKFGKKMVELQPI